MLLSLTAGGFSLLYVLLVSTRKTESREKQTTLKKLNTENESLTTEEKENINLSA